MPAISVILPVYNGGEYLKLSVQSVLNQSFGDFEFLIVDDCSNDGSRAYLQSLNDSRIRCIYNEVNRGLFYNLNFLVSQTNADLIKLWSQDDIMNQGCLGVTVAFHNRNPGLGFSYSGRELINEHGERIEIDFRDKTPEIVSSELHAKIALYTGSIAGNIANVCISKHALVKTGGFKENMKISGDFDMWVRLAEHYPVGFIKEELIRLRNHTGQLSMKENLLVFHMIEDLEVYRYLLGYIDDNSQPLARKILRISKLQFYCTLMIKSLFQFRLNDFKVYFNHLSEFDHIWKLILEFIKTRLAKSHLNQAALFQMEEIHLKSQRQKIS